MKNGNEKDLSPKRPIDKIRASAGKFKVGTPDDESPITGLLSLGDRLLVIKAKGIYQVVLADQIDPDRTNINIPNTIQKLLSYGSDHDWIGAVVLTAHELVKDSVLIDQIQCERVLNHIVEIAQDIAAAKELSTAFAEAEKKEIESFSSRAQQDRSVLLPSLPNGATRVKEFLQRLDHSLRGLFNICKHFYTNVGSGGWDSLKAEIDKGPKDLDNFSKFLDDVLPLLQIIRNSRNCVEHPQQHQRIVFTDFSVSLNTELMVPMLEVVHPRTPLKSVPASDFMNQVSEEIVRIVELMLVFLCARHIRSFQGFPVGVYAFPVNQRRYPTVRYGYGVMNGDTIIRFG